MPWGAPFAGGGAERQDRLPSNSLNKVDYISEWRRYNILVLNPGRIIRFALLSLWLLPVLILNSAARGGEVVIRDLEAVRETKDAFLDEERSAEGYAWLFGISAAGCGFWSVYSPVRHGVIGAPEIASAIGALGLAAASLKSSERKTRFARTRSLLSAALESASPGGVSLERSEALRVEEELVGLRDALAANASGGLRAGCVVPALLCGVAVFGYSLGEGTGRDLAGVCVISALVIGGPAVLNSWNINWRLRRIELLIALWRESVK